MARKPARKRDYHKPSKSVRIPSQLVGPLQQLADRNVTNITQEVVRATREYLERQSLWPPPKT